MTHPNEDLLRRGYEAFATGDIDTVLSVLSHDIAWHVGGSNQTSGDYHGHQEVVGFFMKLVELSGGTFRLDVHDVLANDTHGAVLVTAHGERDGQPLAVREANIWHLADGKATEFWAFAEDQAAVEPVLQLTSRSGRRTVRRIGEQALGLQPDPGLHPVTLGR